jgi:hypothetical protein
MAGLESPEAKTDVTRALLKQASILVSLTTEICFNSPLTHPSRLALVSCFQSLKLRGNYGDRVPSQTHELLRLPGRLHKTDSLIAGRRATITLRVPGSGTHKLQIAQKTPFFFDAVFFDLFFLTLTSPNLGTKDSADVRVSIAALAFRAIN